MALLWCFPDKPSRSDGAWLGIRIMPDEAALLTFRIVGAGNSAKFCGGPNALSLYTYGGQDPANITFIPSGSPTPTNPATPANPNGFVNPPMAGRFTYVDCHTDSVTQRTLSGAASTDGTMTVELCASNCAAFAFFGVEYGQECYCGNILDSSSSTATDGRCSMSCKFPHSLQTCSCAVSTYASCSAGCNSFRCKSWRNFIS